LGAGRERLLKVGVHGAFSAENLYNDRAFLQSLINLDAQDGLDMSGTGGVSTLD